MELINDWMSRRMSTTLLIDSSQFDRDKFILIIDDDPDFSELLEFYLKYNGIKLISAFDAETGFKMLEQMDHLPHLIILDLHLPKMSGLQFREKIRLIPGLSKIPLLFVSVDEMLIYFVEGYFKADGMCGLIDRIQNYIK